MVRCVWVLSVAVLPLLSVSRRVNWFNSGGDWTVGVDGCTSTTWLIAGDTTSF